MSRFPCDNISLNQWISTEALAGFLLMTHLSQPLLAFVCCHLVTLALLAAWHGTSFHETTECRITFIVEMNVAREYSVLEHPESTFCSG